MTGWGIDPYYLLFVLPALIISLVCQFRVKSTFNRYSKEMTARGFTGAQAARMILDAHNLRHIRVERVAGELTDHYDNAGQVIRLSESTCNNASVAAVGVAAHEAGHAVQYADEYGPIRLRTALVPVCNIGANVSWPMILLGYVLGFGILVTIGIALFSLAVLFQLVTLPVEYNASRRAMEILDHSGMMDDGELAGAKKVLSAAAMTYVAALAVSIANLLRLVLLFGNRRGGDRR